jgi:hypothetical protein
MPFVTKLRAIATKQESVVGTAETLTTADNNLRLMDLGVTAEVTMDSNPTKYATGDFGLGESIPGPQSSKVTGTTKFWSDGTTEAAWTKLAKSCGCATTSAAGGYDLYPSVAAINNSLTIGIYDKSSVTTDTALKYEIVGAVGNCSIKADGVGKPYLMAWEFTGGLNDIADLAVSSIPAFSASSQIIPDRFLAGSITIGSHSACASTMEFNFGNTVAPVECQSAPTGYAQYIITDVVPTLTINPLLTKNSTYDPWGKLVAGTIEQIVIETAQFKLTIPRAQITTFSVGDRSGIQETPLTFNCLRPTSAGSYNYAPWIITLKV